MKSLPQNFVPGIVDQKTAQEFTKYLQTKAVDPRNEMEVERHWGLYTQELSGEYGRNVLVGPYTTSNKLYDAGPFSWQSEDIISDIIPDGSQLLQWIPTGTVEAANEVVDHISYVAVDGWDGQNYGTFLAALDVAECEFGPATKFDTTSYEVTYGTFSFSTDTFKVIPSIVVRDQYDRSAMYRSRGSFKGLPLDNDAEFGIARLMHHMQQHVAFVTTDGVLSNSDFEYDGFVEVIATDYVTNHEVSGHGGNNLFSDPLVIDASGFGSTATIINSMRNAVRFIRRRAGQRQIAIQDGDMAWTMPLASWHAIAEELAINGMVPTTSVEFPGDAEERLNRILTGGFGNGAFLVDGRPVPVIIEDNLGTETDTNTTVTSTNYLLTRRGSGVNLLEQQWIDFSTAQAAFTPLMQGSMQMSTGLGGIVRYGEVVENATCWYYFAEMGGRLISRFQPLMARMNNVVLPLNAPFRVESGGYSDHFYANEGTPGSLPAGV